MPDTFAERVDSFWSWFPTVSDDIGQQLSSGSVGGILHEFPEHMQAALPEMSWVFGPGLNGGHSLTVTGEGRKALQLLADRWLRSAPELSGWTFYGSRQPSPREQNESAAIDLGGNVLNLTDLQIAPTVNEETRQVDILAWHPHFAEAEEHQRFQILFLLLDEVLGEFGTQMWIGQIEFGTSAHSLSLVDLPEYLETVQSEDWELTSPIEQYTAYQSAEPVVQFPRSDIFAGFSLYPQLVFEFANNGGPVEEDPVAGTGAEFVFLSIDSSILAHENAVDAREKIQLELENRLKDSALFTGAATGMSSSYLDLLLFDGDVSRRLIRKGLDALNIGDHCELSSFTK